jgi:hypothetical protein
MVQSTPASSFWSVTSNTVVRGVRPYPDLTAMLSLRSMPAMSVTVPPDASRRPGQLRQLVECVLATEPWECSPFAAELQRSVRALAAGMRDCGSRPEQVIIALKRATARSAWRPITTAADALHYRMTLWSVREFFRCDQ